MNKGIIYLVQPTELIGTQRYKIGCSENTELERVKKGYKKGTRYIYIIECYDPFTLEKNIKNIFNEKFKLIAGHEYFEGDETKIKEEFVNEINQYEKKKDIYIDTYNIPILKNNYKDKIIISKDILIKNTDIDECDMFYETLEYVFVGISRFYKQHISLSTKNETDYHIKNLLNNTLKLYNNIVDEIKNDLAEKENCIDTINNIINYITLYKYVIIDTINLHFYDDNKKWYDLCIEIRDNWNSDWGIFSHTKSFCYFLGEYNNNYSFLTSEYLNNIIKYNCKKYRDYEIIKEKNNKYSGIVLYTERTPVFISNVDIDYDYIDNYYGGFYDNCRKYVNENKIIQEHLEGHLDDWEFNDISDYSLYKNDDNEFKKIIYSQIIKLSIKDGFSEKILSLIQNNKSILEEYKDKKIMKKINKYKNLQLFIKNNLKKL
jgi:hypothetical protein